MAYEDYPPAFLGVYPVTEYWPRTTDDDSWNLAEERAHRQCRPQFHSVKHLSRWSLSYPQRMFIKGQSNDEEIRSQALSHIDRHRLVAAPDCGLGLLNKETALEKLKNMCAAAASV